MFNIRQNATHKVVIGPCVAVGDGFTPVTTLAISASDEAEAILHDNATVVSISAYTFAAIATADGYYHLTLQSGISGTVGHMTIVINDDSLCLPIRADFTVLEEAVYDSMYKAAAEGPLQGTTVGNTLDVTATGAAGIDWGNVENKTTANDLSATDIQLADTVTTLTNLPAITTNWLTAPGIAASALDGKGDWNIGKTGYTLIQAFPPNFSQLAIEISTGKITVGTNDDKTGYSSSGTITTLDGLNDVAATDIVSAGAITTLTGAVVNVDTLTTYTGNTPQTADHTAGIADIPTVAEFNARTLLAAAYFDPAADTVANVTTVATTTTNTDMRGTDNALLAASINLTAGAVDNVTTVATTTALTGKTGFSLSAAGDQSIADLILPPTNTAYPDIEFLFVAASDHVTPVTGATGTGVTRSIDGSAFGAGTGTLAEVASGIYQYDASAADMNGKIITFRFTASGGTPGAADDAFVTLTTSL
jgi:hypothetical protein